MKSIIQIIRVLLSLRIYEKVILHFKTVRHFFTDYYLNSKDWFQKQLNYTSTVVISMFGYVLGLGFGDRHGYNMLIDKTDKEIVHIDLGVTFNLGKFLLISETVSFRLIRDIVDGMGITQTEGCLVLILVFKAENIKKRSIK
ncbi:unnamed protein product [Pneumocystis jirovecii]|uniref:Serine/threonine-protein kinase TEL1 n=1 Tax=Pneumocystis jirovecii TaxID=42068 RepID=L0P844_PNEJI|nr:unnamed protein product [Pneumocystis jirovecii]